MAKLITIVVVKDFAAYQSGFARGEKMRNDAGVTNPRMYRDSENPNEVLVLFDAKNAQQATAFANSEDVKAAMKNAGVTSVSAIYGFE
ncbi:MAG: hypothetical protein JWL84_1144 [Rhodospirillales bacterium]|jgi:hypothetical protein|nr:hypothetical protein [Rhodospirillales bacterium]